MQVKQGRSCYSENWGLGVAAGGLLGPIIFVARRQALGARQGHVVIGDNMTALSRDYHPFQAIPANHNRQD